MADLSVQLGPLRLEHPVINASGTMEILDVARSFGPGVLSHPPVAAYVPKTVTLHPREGNPPPRILETPGGMMNAIGLPGEGLGAFVGHTLPQLLELPCPLIISVGGFSVAEYVAMAVGVRDALDALVEGGWTEKAGLELNISCPNVYSGCMSISADPQETERVVGAVRAVWPGLLIAKLSPNVTDISVIGQAAEAAGADALAAVNTYKGLVLDRTTLKPYLGNTTGGLSGPAIRPLGLRAVYELFESVEVPIIGMGGVATSEDVLEFIACGARVVAVGSACFREPLLARLLADGLGRTLEARGLELSGVVGLAHG